MSRRIAIAAVIAAALLGIGASLIGHAGPARAAGTHARGAARSHPAASLTTTATTSVNNPDTSLPAIKHVFIIVLENESASTTFPTSGAAPAPYLADTMVSEGAFLPNYYATGHNSNDNYISMISGQAPNTQNTNDCLLFDDFSSSANTGAPYDQQDGTGCVYPTDIQNIATQLDSAGLTWGDYNEDMGNDSSRESSTCGHPAVDLPDNTQEEESGDAYATRHDPFVYFHNIIDNTGLCDSHVVNLNQLSTALASEATTPDYVFITPNLCHDGHDSSCDTSGENGGFQGINDFLSEWVPKITSSPAFKDNGLLITTFDEASTSDTSDCCGEIPGPGEADPGNNGPGGGRVGAVLLSPCIAAGTVSDIDYNHYSMLGSVENLFGLAHLGYAQLPGESYFGTDIFTRSCGASSTSGTSPPGASTTTGSAPTTTTKTTASGSSPASLSGSASIAGSATRPSISLRGKATSRAAVAETVSIPLSLGSSTVGVSYELQVRQLRGAKASAWRTLEAHATRSTFTFAGRSAATYEFRAEATNAAGQSSALATITVVVPTYAKAAGAVLRGHWTYEQVAGAWRGHAEVGARGGTYSYRYTGAGLQLLASELPAGGRVRVVFDGHSRVISVHASRRAPERIAFSTQAKLGRHTLKLTVLSGELPVEGLVVSDQG